MYIDLCPLVDIETFQWNTSPVVYGMIDERLVIKDELQQQISTELYTPVTMA